MADGIVLDEVRVDELIAKLQAVQQKYGNVIVRYVHYEKGGEHTTQKELPIDLPYHESGIIYI